MGLELLSQYRIQRAVNALQDVRLLPQNLLWYNRIPTVDATEGELLARSLQQVALADIVADDAKATVRREVPITLHDIHMPNVKHGTHFNQETLNLLLRIQNNSGGILPSDFGTVEGYIGKKLVFLERGVKAQCEMMLVGMLLDNLSYDNQGVKFTNITWGMPADLKVTPSTVWSNPAATPITDLLALINLASYKYGVVYDRVTMARADFMSMIATTEFQNLAHLYSQIAFVGAFPINDVNLMQKIAGQMLGGITIEFYDFSVFSENSYGVRTAVRYHPTGKVILTSTAFDNDSSIWDLANGIVTETLVGSLAGLDATEGVIGGFSGPQRGPVGYVTAPHDLNPPNLTVWDVMRAFPRKTELAANAVLTVA